MKNATNELQQLLSAFVAFPIRCPLTSSRLGPRKATQLIVFCVAFFDPMLVCSDYVTNTWGSINVNKHKRLRLGLLQ
jgi:hypothetical protein